MSTARDVMHTGAECIDENETLASAAEMMRGILRYDSAGGASPMQIA